MTPTDLSNFFGSLIFDLRLATIKFNNKLKAKSVDNINDNNFIASCMVPNPKLNYKIFSNLLAVQDPSKILLQGRIIQTIIWMFYFVG